MNRRRVDRETAVVILAVIPSLVVMGIVVTIYLLLAMIQGVPR